MSKRAIARTIFVVAAALFALWLMVWDGTRAPSDGPSNIATSDVGIELPTSVDWAPPVLTTISGTIRSRSGGQLINSMVCVYSADLISHVTPPQCSATDADGRYAIADVAVGNYNISATADAHLPALVNKDGPLRVRGDVTGLDAELLDGGARVAGSVVDATGGPVAGALVQAGFGSSEIESGRLLFQIARSDQNGAFALSMPQGRVFLVVRADGYANGGTATFAPAQDVRVVVTPESSISGRVVAHQPGAPLSSVRVTARSENRLETAMADESGAFVLAGLVPGNYALSATGKGWIGRKADTVTVDISAQVAGVEVALTRGVQVAGVIRVGDRPCTSGSAYLRPAEGESLPALTALTNSFGEVEFDAVPPGNYSSIGICDDYGQKEGPVLSIGAANVTGQTWNLPQGTSVVVHAQTPERQPVARAWIMLSQSSASADELAPKQGQTNTDGFAQLLAVPAGSYLIESPDLETPVPIELAPGRDSAEFTVTLKPLGAIEVTVTDAKGRTNDAVAVSALPTDENRPGPMGEPRGGGRYYLGPMPPGDYRVEVRDSVNPRAVAKTNGGIVQVRSSELTKLTLEYGGQSGRIAGRVLDTSGAPIQNVWVGAQTADFDTDPYGRVLVPKLAEINERRSLSDAQGRFELEGLSETAEFSITATHTDGARARVDHAKVGQDVELRLAAPARIAGHVVNRDGKPPAFFELMLLNAGSGQQELFELGPDAQGKWSIDHVHAGSVQLIAQSREGTASVTRDVTAGQHLDGLVLNLEPRSATASRD